MKGNCLNQPECSGLRPLVIHIVHIRQIPSKKVRVCVFQVQEPEIKSLPLDLVKHNQRKGEKKHEK